MDFTIEKYRELLVALKSHNNFRIRHDVDLKPAFSLRIAQVEAELGLHGTYYFRTVPESYDEAIIQQIVSLGHTAGYHYECMTTCDGNIEAAYEDFCLNLEALRKLVPVKSICMHGSPRSPYDSKDIWKKYDYKTLGIENEPYLDTDFSKVFYLTDTGRRWDGYKVSVRDKIPQYQEEWTARGLTFHTTDDVIDGLRKGIIPEGLMITVHPQRWNPFGLKWVKELVLQHVKNIVKRLIIKKK